MRKSLSAVIVVLTMILGFSYSLLQSSSLFSRRNFALFANAHLSKSAKKVKLLREILQKSELSIMPCCFDGISARLVEQAGFNVTFMTGFGVSATYGLPDTGLTSAADMFHSASTICDALEHIPCIGDGDTVSNGFLAAAK